MVEEVIKIKCDCGKEIEIVVNVDFEAKVVSVSKRIGLFLYKQTT